MGKTLSFCLAHSAMTEIPIDRLTAAFIKSAGPMRKIHHATTNAPGRIVFENQCFDSSEAKSNVKLTLRDKDKKWFLRAL